MGTELATLEQAMFPNC